MTSKGSALLKRSSSDLSTVTERTNMTDIGDEFPSLEARDNLYVPTVASEYAPFGNVNDKLSALLEYELSGNDVHLEKELFIHDLSQKLNELQGSFAQNRDAASLANREKPVFIDNVRITPGIMIFKDAYDGKSYNQTLTITNCGKHSVSVRIFPPTSKAFKIKPAKTGHMLSSGLTLVRKIRYLYTKPTAIPQAMMDIYVNNTSYRYELLVVTCYTQISVTPKIIDFGEIDVGMVSAVRFLTITNTGTKQAQYAIDLGRNQMEIIIEPLKGTVQPGESKKVTVEVFGIVEGEFKQEFWIKTDPLQRVHIQGHFIEPSLAVDYPLADKNFLLLDFPKTFVGVRQQRNVVIKNHSSTSAIFCVMGQTMDEKFPLKDAGPKDVNYRQFYINPTEGRLHSNQQFILGLTFVPQKPQNRPDYYICSVTVDVKRCRIGNARTPMTHHPDSHNINNAPLLDAISVATIDEQGEPVDEVNLTLHNVITILLYGEVEIPSITIEPEKLVLKNLEVNQFHAEPLKILNNSKTLPVVIKYNKIACIEIEPRTIYLPPNQEVDSILKIKPCKMGDMDVNVVFDVFFRQQKYVENIGTVTLAVSYSSGYCPKLRLLKRPAHFVPGITPLITNEVGYDVEDVRFNTNIEKPRQAILRTTLLAVDKNNDALIAFPNDMPQSMRPWRNTVPCHTIFAQLPRIVTKYDADYDLTSKEKLLRDTKNSYYKNYIDGLALQQSTKEFDETFEDYATTNDKLALMENFKFKTGDCPPLMNYFDKKSLFVPLKPYELHKVIVTPNFIQLGKLAAHSECSNNFNVENQNGFPVHLSIKPLYRSITILQEQFILAPNSQKDINFTYQSDSNGTHHIPVFVVLNFFHVFDVTVLAQIVSNTVKCLTKDILIVPTEKTAFLELKNPINSDVKFVIDTTFFHLESYPSSGVIPPKRTMTCTITFNPEVGYMPIKEIAVVSESGAKELIEVHFDRKRAAMALSSEVIDFGDIPLNTVVSKELTIKNNSDQLVPVNVDIENSDCFPELFINPSRALLWQKGDIVITFTININEVVNFTIPVKITFQYDYPQYLKVTGRAVFPDVSLSPGLIKIRKIPSGSVVKTPFKVANSGSVTNFLSFALQDFPEFSVKTKTGENVTNGVTLLSKEKKELFLQFSPQEPVAYCIYLPYVLNGIVGPPELNRPETLKPKTYISHVKNEYKESYETIAKLKVVKILCAAGKKWLTFSCLDIKFSTSDKTQEQFVVTNTGQATQEIAFKIRHIEAFRFIAGDYMPIVDEDLETILSPGDSFTITVEFNPKTYGTFTSEVPIYVKDYSETDVFNHLKLRGSNPEPQILSSKTLCSFVPTYIGSRLEKSLVFELITHTCNGNVNINCGDPHIDVEFLRQEQVSTCKIVLYYNIVFAPQEDCIVETKITCSCACAASTELEVFACGDSSLVINCMSDPSIVGNSTYPFFPEVDDTSDYALFMHSIVPIIERWLYTQGFLYQNYYKIPDDIARYPVDTESGKKNKSDTSKKTYPQLPLVQLLINLMGKSILKYVDNGLRPPKNSQDLKGRTLYNYVTYRNTISYLKSQGIHVPGLKPEFLLPYAEYIYCTKNLIDKERTSLMEHIFPEELFYTFSKQKWLDLFFRIYKVIVFQRIIDSPTVDESAEKDFLTEDRKSFEKFFKRNVKRFPSWFKCDAKILLWLEYHLNRQRKLLWPSEDFGAYTRFEKFANIDDSVALATVTAAYCPYLRDQLRDVYACPKKIEHKIHNACKVVQVWKGLKLSLDVHPQTIVTANHIKILFIVTYLYEVLPYYYLSDEIRIEAPLSNQAAYELNIANCGDIAIKYVAIFFGEGSELFKLDNQQIAIPAKQSKTIKLTYFAKRVLEAKSILVLSGESSGQMYARTRAISISGVPDTSECEEIKVQVPTYEIAKRRISLQSPYGKNYTAKIFMCFGEPKSNKDFYDVSIIKARNIPREVTVTHNTCKFIDKGQATITLEMCFLSQGPKQFYLYFCNDVVGDFCVLISIMSITKQTTADDITIKVPECFKASCICRRGFNTHCPKIFKLEINSRNLSLWKSTAVMMDRCFTNSISLRMIMRYFGTPLIYRMMKFYLERFPQGFMLPSIIFDDQAEFKISHNKKYSTQTSTLKVRDVTSEETIPLIIHWNDPGLPDEEYIELTNTNEKEIRYISFKVTPLKILTDPNRVTFLANPSLLLDQFVYQDIIRLDTGEQLWHSVVVLHLSGPRVTGSGESIF